MLLPEKIFVIAGDYGQFKLFRRQLADQIMQEGIEFKTSDIVYVMMPEYLRGSRDIMGYLVGTWRDRRDMPDILLMMIQNGWSENFVEVEL